jgi:hypothetical protein
MGAYRARYGDRAELPVSGEPYLLASRVQELWDGAWLAGLSLLVVLAVLWRELRHWSCAV